MTLACDGALCADLVSFLERYAVVSDAGDAVGQLLGEGGASSRIRGGGRLDGTFVVHLREGGREGGRGEREGGREGIVKGGKERRREGREGEREGGREGGKENKNRNNSK